MFTALDFDHWPRREIFTCFRRTAIYLTVQVDVTGLWRRCKRGGLRLYPALIYGAARVVNGDPAFRYGFDQQGRLGLWDRLTPYYTVPRREGGEARLCGGVEGAGAAASCEWRRIWALDGVA